MAKEAGGAKSVATVLAIVTRSLDLLKHFGWGSAIQVAVLSWLVLLWAWLQPFVNSLAWYWWLLLGLVVCSLVMNIGLAARKAWVERKLKTLDIAGLAKLCTDYFADWSAWQQAHVVAPRRAIGKLTRDDHHLQWESEIARKRQADEEMYGRFAPRAFAIVHLFRSYGIGQPDLYFFEQGDRFVSGYIGTVGNLLSNGLLDEARKLDPAAPWTKTMP